MPPSIVMNDKKQQAWLSGRAKIEKGGLKNLFGGKSDVMHQK